MLPKKTTIVLGAGASKEVGLPTGDELKRRIVSSLNFDYNLGNPTSGDHTIFRTLQQEPNIDACFRAAEMIREALPLASSIDEYIHSHRDNKEIERCLKIAIVKHIIEAERKSDLYVNPGQNQLDFGPIEDTWFTGFWKQITKGCAADNLEARFGSVALIVFNYDRCLEHYLYLAIQKFYPSLANVAENIVNSITIFHPYGVVGSLPWQGVPAQIGFGIEPNFTELGKLAMQISTFTEGTNLQVSNIRNRVAEADRLIFLGFAYHPQNITLLSGSERLEKGKTTQCWGTAYGVSEDDLEAIKRELEQLYGYRVLPGAIKDIECRALFETYSRALSFT